MKKIFSIRYKFILSFLVPLVFMVAIGYASYHTAEEGMREKYEESTAETIRMAADHVDLVSSFMKSEATKYAYNDDLNRIITNSFSNVIAKKDALETLRTDILASQSGNDFINNLHIVTPTGIQMFSTKASTIDGIFDNYKTEASDESGEVIAWIDAHPSLDEALNMNGGSDSYVFSYQALSTGKNAIVVVDASEESMQAFLDEINLGDNSVISLVTMNGRELFHETPAAGAVAKYKQGDNIFYGQSFYNNALAKGESGLETVSYGGEECLFFYTPCELSGCMICALVPVDTVTGQADSIKELSLSLVILALVIVVLIGFFISLSIQNNMSRVSKSLGEVAEGDLTVSVKVKGHDEFRNLAGVATDMIDNTKKLVQKVDDATLGLETSTGNVKQASDTLDECSENITNAISDISAGMNRQSRHVAACVSTTEELSAEIKNVSKMVNNIQSTISDTKTMIDEGVGLIKELGSMAADTTQATDLVSESIEALLTEAEKINSFVGIITSISGQTNLLSLNASIEAARAGEAGRGFAVVAEEIRKLADESAQAAGEINKLVDSINNQSRVSVANAEKAQTAVNLQTDLVNKSVEIFNKTEECIANLYVCLDEINEATGKADSMRKEAVSAVRDISDIINENAGNAQTVMGVANQLKENIDNLDRTATELGESMGELKTEISVFKI